METIRRQINPEVRVVDAERGIVDYVASDETVDSYREVIRARGWRFNLFKKNAPFVDSHDYRTIGNLIGKVIDFRVESAKGRLINRVQWAVGTGNELAELGWRMTESGYLKAVSVGFMPVKILTANSAPRSEWLQQLRELDLDETKAPRAIYLEQEQIELSSCIIGANGNALLAAHKAGALSDHDVELVQKHGTKNGKSFQIPFASETQNPPDDMKTKILKAFRGATAKQSSGALEKLRAAQRSESDDGLIQAVQSVRYAEQLERRASLNECIERVLSDPLRRLALNALARHFTRCKMNCEQEEFIKALSEESGFGSNLITEIFGDEIYNLLAIHGAWATLGARPIRSKTAKFPVTTAYPNAAFIHQGVALDEDATFDGTSVSTDTATIACMISVALTLIQDSDADLSAHLLENFEQAMNRRLDTACFIGTGADDASNGGNTGIFVDATINTVVAAAGNVKLEQCEREDFLRVMEAVDAATLQRPCRWWLSSALLPAALRCKDTGGKPLIKTVSEGEGFYLLGSPVTLTAVAPSTNAAAQNVIAFGDGLAYAVGLRNWFTFEASSDHKWTNLQRSFRGYGNAKGKLRKKEGFVILKTAAA